MDTAHKQLYSYGKALGLTDNEIKCYSASLTLGPASIQQIAREMKTVRSSVYLLVDHLKQKGLLTEEPQDHGRLIIPEPPSRLKAMLANRQRFFRRQELDIEEQMPELMALYQEGQYRPTARVYEGRAGLEFIHEDILAEGEDFVCYPHLDLAIKILPMDFQIDFVNRRIEAGMYVRGLLTPGPAADQILRETGSARRQARINPFGKALSAEKIIYGNKVALLTYKKRVSAIVVEHPELADMERELFDTIWDLAEIYPVDTYDNKQHEDNSE